MEETTFFEKLLFPPNSPLGNNEHSINHLWKVLNSLLENGNSITQNIIANFLEVKDTIQIFDSKSGSNYLYFFKALEIDRNSGDTELIHELGHFYYNNLLNNDELLKIFPDINERAKTRCYQIKNANFTFDNIKFENAKFSNLLEQMNKEIYRTKEKKEQIGPFSDILSAICLGVNRFATPDKRYFTLPYSHSYEYYRKEDIVDYARVFDEQFANFFALFVTNKTDLLETLRVLLGDEWYRIMQNTLLQIEAILIQKKEEKLKI